MTRDRELQLLIVDQDVDTLTRWAQRLQRLRYQAPVRAPHSNEVEHFTAWIRLTKGALVPTMRRLGIPLIASAAADRARTSGTVMDDRPCSSHPQWLQPRDCSIAGVPVHISMTRVNIQIRMFGAKLWSLCEADMEHAVKLDAFLCTLPLHFQEPPFLCIQPERWPDFFAPQDGG